MIQNNQNLNEFSRSYSYVGSPSVIERATNNMVSLDIYSKLLNNRIVFCNGVVEAEMAADIVAQLLYLDHLSSEPIYMYINSPGGSIPAGLSIVDTMKVIKSPVYTICTGMAASMGSVILSNGEKGHRRALPHATIMLHGPSTGIGYIKCQDLTIEAREMERIKNVLFTILAENTGKSLEQISKDADRDFYMDAQASKEYGLIDSIV